jgi:hypothetical protein
MNKYDDIINISHFEPHHPRMSMDARGAQFAPYAALTGYSDCVDEAGRLTSSKHEVDEELYRELNEKIQIIESKIKENPEVEITYFIPDLLKVGGEYKTIKNKVKRIDNVNRIIYMINKTKIKIDDILNINI